MLAFWSVAPFHADIWWDWKGFSLLADCDWCVSRGHPVTWSLVLSRGYTMESFQVSAWSLLNPLPPLQFFFLFKCVKRSLILCFNIWINIVWLVPAKKRKTTWRKKREWFKSSSFKFCSTVIFKITFATLLDSTQNYRLKGTGKWYWRRGNETQPRRRTVCSMWVSVKRLEATQTGWSQPAEFTLIFLKVFLKEPNYSFTRSQSAGPH